MEGIIDGGEMMKLSHTCCTYHYNITKKGSVLQPQERLAEHLFEFVNWQSNVL